MAKQVKQSTVSKEFLLTVSVKLEKLNDKIDSMGEAMERMVLMQSELIKNLSKKSVQRRGDGLEPDVVTLLSLPASLRKTAMALYKIPSATADTLAVETRRLRAVESASANQLVRMGYVRKRREGRKVYFYIE